VKEREKEGARGTPQWSSRSTQEGLSRTRSAGCVRQVARPRWALALEIGVSNSTITRWKQLLLRALSLSALETAAMSTTSTASTRPLDRSAEDKLRLLMEARSLADEDLGAFLRREGIHQAHLDQ
jgi:hypothetical protein